jgi:hypothetical protein
LLDKIIIKNNKLISFKSKKNIDYMKYVKLFENFTNEEVSFQNPNGNMVSTHTFGPEEHGDFCLTVSECIEKNNKPVAWCLYSNPSNQTGFGLTIQRAETFWKQYVNGEKKFTVVEMDDKLIGVLHEGDKILMAFDEKDFKVDPSTLNGLKF